MSERPADVRLPMLEILVEDAGPLGCMGHIPALPGLCFRAETVAELEKTAPARVAEYARWLLAVDLADLTPETALWTRLLTAGGPSDVRIVAAEHVAGAPVWKSGNPAVLFQHDLRSLSDGAVDSHLRFTRSVLKIVREMVAPLSPEQRVGRPSPDRRSTDETLEHIGNCVWWYCSRIDDDLPEPEDLSNEDPLDRIDRLFNAAEAYLLGVPSSKRGAIHIPTRFPTSDPQERWTHAKVCRRQAEHAWSHLRSLESESKIP